MSEELYDEDGFRLGFEDDTSEQEKQFFMRAFPNVNKISERKVHCTSCYMHIGTAPISEAVIRMHPVLRVTHCRNCHTFYNSGEFDKGEDGSELYCRWCGQGGEVYCCSKCPYVFCKKCIVQNLSRACVQDISRNDNWQCFSCAPKIMWHLRAQHWALINYIEKQKKDMKDQNLSVPAINNMMKQDNTTCCSNKGLNKKQATATVAKKGQKRPSDANELPSPGTAKIPEKRPGPRPSLPGQQQVAAPPAAKKAKSNDEVVCTPDIMSMFMNPEEPPPLVAAARPGPAAKPVPTGAPIPSMQNRQVLVRPAIPNAVNPAPMRMPANNPTTSAPPPVYHTINGYRIDLHTAAQQGTYRLPNGKLIQVRKQAPSPATPSTVVPARTNVTIAPKPMFNPATLGQNTTVRMTNGGATHVNYALQQQQQIQEQRLQQQRLQQQQQQQQILQQQRLQQANIQPGQPQPTIVAGLPNPALQLPTLALLQNMFNGAHEDSPLGKSRKNFEGKLLSGVEICQHIVNKINTLTNSNSFKNIRNVRDLKELYIHVSYLLTYAIGRFKTLQEKCVDDVKKMGFTKESDFVMMGEQISNRNPDEDKSDDEGDCEIVEQNTTLIELDSDDEDDTDKKKKKDDAEGSKALNTSETEAAVAAILEDKGDANTSGEQISMADFLQVSLGESPEKKAPADDDSTSVAAADSSTDEKKGGSEMIEVIEATEEECAAETAGKSGSAEAEAKDASDAEETKKKPADDESKSVKTDEVKAEPGSPEAAEEDKDGETSETADEDHKKAEESHTADEEQKESQKGDETEETDSKSIAAEANPEETTEAEEVDAKSAAEADNKDADSQPVAEEEKTAESEVTEENSVESTSTEIAKEKESETEANVEKQDEQNELKTVEAKVDSQDKLEVVENDQENEESKSTEDAELKTVEAKDDSQEKPEVAENDQEKKESKSTEDTELKTVETKDVSQEGAQQGESANPETESSTEEDNKMETEVAASETPEETSTSTEAKTSETEVPEPATEVVPSKSDLESVGANSAESMETDNDAEFATASSTSVQSTEKEDTAETAEDGSSPTETLLKDILNQETVAQVPPIDEEPSEPSPTELFAQMEDSLQKVQEIFESTGGAVQDDDITESQPAPDTVGADADTDMADMPTGPVPEAAAESMEVDEDPQEGSTTKEAAVLENVASTDAPPSDATDETPTKNEGLEEIFSDDNFTQDSVDAAAPAEEGQAVTAEPLDELENIDSPETEEVNGTC